VRYAALPTSTQFDEAANNLSEKNRTVHITVRQGGDYYVLVHGRVGAAAGQTFSLTPTIAAFGPRRCCRITAATTATSLSPSPVRVHGIDPRQSGHRTATGRRIECPFVDANTLFATFD